MIRHTVPLVAALALLTGCGPPTKKVVTVEGTVTYKGQQLKSGIVKFVAPNGDFATANVRPDGTFSMTDVVPGEQKVGYVGGPMSSGSSDGSAAPGGAAAKAAAAVPPKFGDPQTSGVTVTVLDAGGAVTVELK